jgi:hypothetical protein
MEDRTRINVFIVMRLGNTAMVNPSVSRIYRISQDSGRLERNDPPRINGKVFSGLWIAALSLLFRLDRPFAEAGDHDVLSLAETILDYVKETINNTDTVFPGDVEVRVCGFDDVILGQAHNGFPPLSIPLLLQNPKTVWCENTKNRTRFKAFY